MAKTRKFVFLTDYDYNSGKKKRKIDNIIYLLRQSVGRAHIRSEIYAERMMFMVSWNDLFSFVIMLMAILTYIDVHDRHKK